MKITFVTESHMTGDDKQSVDVVTHDEFNNGIVKNHEERLNNHDRKIADLYKNVGENKTAHNQRMDNIDRWIGEIAKRVDGMPQTFRETLEQVARETFDDKLDCFAKQVEELREERKQISTQLEELRKERQETQAQLDVLRSQCTEAQARLEKLTEQLSEAKKFEDKMNDDFSMQVAEFKMQVPVPKKFAKFLFLKTEPAANEEN